MISHIDIDIDFGVVSQWYMDDYIAKQLGVTPDTEFIYVTPQGA